MHKTYKVGLIGLGGIAKGAHMSAYGRMDNVELAAICDIVPSKIEAFKERYQLPDDFPAFTDYHDLLNVEGLDYVDICTPNYLHSIIAVDALNKGLNVFTEKPDAVSVAEVTKMKEAAEKSGKILMAMRNNRHRNTAKFLKNYIANGNMGDIYCGRCGWIRRRGIPGKGGWFTTKEQSGGGPLIDLGVHMIDLAIWLMGNPTPVAVTGCAYTKFADSEVSDSIHSAFGEKKADGIFSATMVTAVCTWKWGQKSWQAAIPLIIMPMISAFRIVPVRMKKRQERILFAVLKLHMLLFQVTVRLTAAANFSSIHRCRAENMKLTNGVPPR